MENKKESLNKAKESWKKIAEWWKEFWIWAWNVVWWTTKSIFYTIEWAWEAGVSKVSKKKSENLEYSSEVRKEYKEKAEKYSKRSKESFSKAWKSAKQAFWWLWKMGEWWVKLVWNAAKAWYYLVDAWDKAIWEKITEKRRENWEGKISKTKKFFRNNILKLLIAWSVVWYWWVEAVQYSRDDNRPNKEIQNHNINWNSTDTLLVSTQWYDILTRKPITTNAPLTRWYLWWDLENSWELDIWDTLALNPAESLHNLWSKKIKKYGHNTISQLDTIDVSSMSPEEIESFRAKYPIDATYLFVVRPYTDWKENRETMSIQEFINQTNNIVVNTREFTKDYYGPLKSNDKKELFDAIRNNITWECIAAYAMTELCENKENGEFNKQLFDLLLRNSWANYLSKVPAIYDNKTSYWLYQFTEYALHDIPWDVRWASLVNKVVPEEDKIPWSVIDLINWQEQTKAAYMFAIQNLSTAVSKLTDQQAKDLLAYHRSNKVKFMDNMTQLIAMCHHMPVDASALKKRHEAKYKNDINNYGRAKTYGKASKNNYEALKR